MDYDEMYAFIDNMPEVQFDDKFLNIARTSEFSAIMSGFWTERDVEKLRSSMLTAGVHKDWYDDEIMRKLLCFRITGRIMKKKKTT